jgi:hypothetical protein
VTEPVVDRYLRLGLQLDRHVEGTVDAYFGPQEPAAAVAAAEPVDPGTLVAQAEALLDELDDGWLRDQVVGLRTYAGVLAGEALSYADEVERCYGVRPEHTDEAVFAAAHAELEDLLPGEGTLGERYEGWRRSTLVPPEHVERVVGAAIGRARAWTARLIDLPEGEGVTVELVNDKPWMAFCAYLGDLQSRISVNVDLPKPAIDVLHLILHETYPGHHAERCVKEQVLVRGRGLLEETIVLVPTPQSLVAEGIAELAPSTLLDGDAGAELADVVHDVGVEFDLAHALAVERAHEPCRWADVNAALMVHDEGASEADARAYLERWGLMTPEISAHLIRFLNERTSRSYILTYAAGHELCRAYVAGRPERFRHLLTEQVRVGDLLDAR